MPQAHHDHRDSLYPKSSLDYKVFGRALSLAPRQCRRGIYARSEHKASEGRHAQHHRYRYQPVATLLRVLDQPTARCFSDQYSVGNTS